MTREKSKGVALRLAAFTLVEMIIALSLFAVIAIAAYGSFRSGFVAYQRIEAKLGKDHELQMLLWQINQDLRGALYYAPIPFEGRSDALRFPARLVRYEDRTPREDVYQVTYEFRDRELRRSEKKLRKRFRDSGDEDKEKLLRFESWKFQFAYQDKSGDVVWKNEWSDKPYLGLPKGIRLVFQGEAAGRQEMNVPILIPQGILAEVNN